MVKRIKAMTESQFIKKFKEYLEPKGWLVFKINERFSSGFPDLICIKDGMVKFIEAKIEDNPLTKLQLYTLQQIAKHNGNAHVIRWHKQDDGHIFWNVYDVQADGKLKKGDIDYPFNRYSNVNEAEYENLGYANGWWCNPLKYIDCIKVKHKHRYKNIGKCQMQVFCDTCRITWKVDSGD